MRTVGEHEPLAEQDARQQASIDEADRNVRTKAEQPEAEAIRKRAIEECTRIYRLMLRRCARGETEEQKTDRLAVQSKVLATLGKSNFDFQRDVTALRNYLQTKEDTGKFDLAGMKSKAAELRERIRSLEEEKLKNDPIHQAKLELARVEQLLMSNERQYQNMQMAREGLQGLIHPEDF